MSEMTSEEYRKMLGIPDEVESIMSAAEFRQFQAGTVGFSLSLLDAEPVAEKKKQGPPKAQTDFEEWLDAVAPFRVLREYRLIPGRMFRADYAIPELKLAMEYDGMNPVKGKHAAHTSKQALVNDSDKGNLAQLAGYMWIRVNAQSLRKGTAYTQVQAAIDLRMRQREE